MKNQAVVDEINHASLSVLHIISINDTLKSIPTCGACYKVCKKTKETEDLPVKCQGSSVFFVIMKKSIAFQLKKLFCETPFVDYSIL